MFAAITRLKFLPCSAEASYDLLGSLVMPAYVDRVARGAWIFTHPENSSAMVIVLYDTKEAAEAGEEKKAVEEIMQAHGNMLAEPLCRDVYHVAMGSVSGAPARSLPPLSGDILSLLADLSRSL